MSQASSNVYHSNGLLILLQAFNQLFFHRKPIKPVSRVSTSHPDVEVAKKRWIFWLHDPRKAVELSIISVLKGTVHDICGISIFGFCKVRWQFVKCWCDKVITVTINMSFFYQKWQCLLVFYSSLCYWVRQSLWDRCCFKANLIHLINDSCGCEVSQKTSWRMSMNINISRYVMLREERQTQKCWISARVFLEFFHALAAGLRLF